MEKKEKTTYELGNIYGSRMSKKGTYLNLLVLTTHNGEALTICVPVKINNDREGKPSACVDLVACNASIERVKVFKGKDDSHEDDSHEEEIPEDCELPF